MQVLKSREDKPMLGLAMMCVTMFTFTLVDTSAKWLILGGLPIIQVVFVRYAGHFAGALVIFAAREGLGAFRSNRPKLQLFRALAILGSTLLNFSALKFLPITITTAIFFASPIVITILSATFLGEKVGLRRLSAILVGFLGVLIVVQPWGAAFHPAMLLSVAALLCGSAYFVFTRLLAGVDSNATSQLWASGLAVTVLLPFSLANWQWPQTPLQWALICAIGLLGLGGHAIAVAAHRFADASTLAPVIYIQAIYAAATGYLVFGNLPNWATAVGTVIIITSGAYIWQRERTLMLQRQRLESTALTR